MSIRKNKKQVETLAWITDDEAEFWTSITPTRSPKLVTSISNLSQSKKYSSETSLPDGEHFKFNNLPEKRIIKEDILPQQQIKEETIKEDILPQQKIKDENKQTTQILQHKIKEKFQKTNEKQLKEDQTLSQINNQQQIKEKNDNTQKQNLTFVNELRQELSALTEPNKNDLPGKDKQKGQEDYLESNSNGNIENKREILNNKNSNQNTNINSDNDTIKDKVKSIIGDANVKEKALTFIDELAEETHVIRGKLDQDSFVNRRSRRAKGSNSFTQQNLQFVHQNSV